MGKEISRDEIRDIIESAVSEALKKKGATLAKPAETKTTERECISQNERVKRWYLGKQAMVKDLIARKKFKEAKKYALEFGCARILKKAMKAEKPATGPSGKKTFSKRYKIVGVSKLKRWIGRLTYMEKRSAQLRKELTCALRLKRKHQPREKSIDLEDDEYDQA